MSLDLSRLGAWAELAFFTDALPAIEAKLAADPRDILPPAHQIFAALEACQPAACRVVILGQDPYPTPGHAHGLAFSTEPDVMPLPRSLANIFKEMEADLGAHPLPEFSACCVREIGVLVEFRCFPCGYIIDGKTQPPESDELLVRLLSGELFKLILHLVLIEQILFLDLDTVTDQEALIVGQSLGIAATVHAHQEEYPDHP